MISALGNKRTAPYIARSKTTLIRSLLRFRMKTIGRIDIANFPELALEDISIKVDTGAYTSSIHCHEIKELEENGSKFIAFKLLDSSHPQYQDKVLKTSSYIEKRVKSSNGQVESRFIISTNIFLFGEVLPIELSLSERSNMKYPVLLGRKFLSHKFIVDTSLKNLSSKLNN